MRSPALALLLTMTAVSALRSQDPGPKPAPRIALMREALAGQVMPLMPLTHVVRDSTLRDSTVPGDRAEMLAWADSIVAEAMVERAPEISWLHGSELRRVARRSAGIIPEPHRFGHAILRAGNLRTVPDPTRSHFRTMAALAGGRHVFVPASLVLGRDEEGAVRATLIVVVADSRTGRLIWRSEALGTGPTTAAALRAAVEYFLPDPSGTS